MSFRSLFGYLMAPRKRQRLRRPEVECLENRTVPSTIQWSETGFDAVYGPNAAAARAIVARAVNDWSQVIVDFNYQNVGQPCNPAGFCPAAVANTFYLGFTARNLGDSARGEAFNITNYDPDGKPTNAGITLDDNGGGKGWYFDSNKDNAEFTNLVTRYRANFTGPGAQADDVDFYRTVLHEIGHTMGLGAFPPTFAAIQGYMTDRGVDQTPTASGGIDGSRLWLFSRFGVSATFTSIGGGHLYEGPADPRFPSDPVHPNDLMNPGRTEATQPTTRTLISDLDAIILGLAYGYTVNMPSTLQTFLAVNNSATRVLTINGDPETVNDFITLRTSRVLGQTVLTVDVNGIKSTWLPAQISGGVIVQSANGSDTINVDSVPNGVSVTILGGNNGDTINVTDPNGPLTIYGDAGADRITVRSSRADVGISIDGGSEADTIVADTVAGPLTIAGARGADRIDVASSYTGASLLRGGDGDDTITIRAAAGPMTVKGDAGADTVNVERLYRGAPATLDGGTELDQFYISPVLRNLSNIQSSVSVDGGAMLGDDYLRVDDSGNYSKNRSITVTNGSVELPGGTARITYTAVGTVLVQAGSASDSTVNVHSTLDRVFTSVAGAANVNIGAPIPYCSNCGKTTKDVDGLVSLLNLFGATALTIDDSTDGTPRTVGVTPLEVSGLTDIPISYQFAFLSSLTVNAGAAGNVFLVHDTAPGDYPIQLNTGLGVDTTYVYANHAPVTVNGQNSQDPTGQNRKDTVYLGLNQSLDSIRAPVTITNFGNWSAVNLDDSADTTGDNVTMSSSGYYTYLRGLAPAAYIRMRGRDLSALNILAGSGNNVFNVNDTPLSTIPGGMTTTLLSGTGNDVVTVTGTTGPILVDGQGSLNQFVVGGNPTGLNRINGAVTVRGAGGVNLLTVSDAPSTTSHNYVLDRNLVQRTDKAPIFHQDLTGLEVTAGAAYDQITILDTSPTVVTNVNTGGGDDYVAVARTTGDLALSAGGSSFIEVGNNVSSLDAIQGAISVYPVGGNAMTLRFVDTAATAPQTLTVDANVFGQTYARSGAAAIGVFFSPVANFEYTGGSGGTTAFVYGTVAGTTSRFYGTPGVLDTFAVGFAGDMNRILGPVYGYGQAADNDFAYYYDYLNANPQLYQFSQHPLDSRALVAERSGIAPVTFTNLGQVIVYAPLVGGSSVNVTGLPAQTFLNMGAGDGDVVTLGSNAPNLGGSLANILAPVSVGAYGHTADITLIIDNSGNTDTTPRRAEILVSPTLVGLAPAPIHWNLSPDSSVEIRGGAADETFALQATEFVTPISIDGGGGVNTLDYSAYNPAMPGLVAWWKGEGNAQDAVGDRHGTPFGDTTFVAGKVGQAFRFDGAGDYVQVGNSPSLEPTTVSVEAWVNSATPQDYGYILTKGTDPFQGNSYALLTSASSGLWFVIGNASAVNYSPDPGSGIWDGTWHHVVGTFDGTYIRLYVDGTEVGNGTLANMSIGYNLSDPNLSIGSYGNHARYSFDGLIDEVSVFNRALSAEEVQKIYQAGSAGKSALAQGVTVNLPLGTATGLRGGIANIRNVIGSAGDDILVGNGGNVLFGGVGRDLLLAGGLASQLYGGGDEDILIGGTLNDGSRANLDAILAEWTRTGDGNDYASRVARLRAGLLADGTVTGNGGGNTLTGEGGLDLFFGSFVTDWQVDDGEWVFPL